MFEFAPIGFVQSCFHEKFGIPRQPGLAPATRAKIVMQAPFDQEQAFAGLEGVSHVWVQFVFHGNGQQGWRPKVRPPRLGGNRSVGVFATRSPFRPNPLGLSVVRYLGWERDSRGLCVLIAGHDLLDQTPVLDIKPYVPYVDQVPDALNPWAAHAPRIMPVSFAQRAEIALQHLAQSQDVDWRQLITEVLQQDPRPAYQTAPERTYGCNLYNHNVRWKVLRYQDTATIEVVDIEPRV